MFIRSIDHLLLGYGGFVSLIYCIYSFSDFLRQPTLLDHDEYYDHLLASPVNSNPLTLVVP